MTQHRMTAVASGPFNDTYPTDFARDMDMELARMQRSFLEVQKQVHSIHFPSKFAAVQYMRTCELAWKKTILMDLGCADGDRISRDRQESS